MITILILIAAALVLVFFEVLLPGGVLGILAFGCVLGATALGFVEFGVVGATLVFFGSLIAVIALIFVEFKWMAKSKLAKGFFLDKTVTGQVNDNLADREIAGQEGVTLTRLNPTGRVSIGGQTYEAFSEDGYAEAGQPVTVVSRDNFKLIIKKR